MLSALPLSTSLCRLARAQTRGDGHEPLTRIDDLRVLALQVRQQQRPLLLFFSLPGCPFCLEVRRSHLAPLALDAGRGPLIREIDITSRRTFVGLDGRNTTESEFAGAQKVRIVPHVALADADLKPLAEPMIGIGAADFYGAYLSDAIENATRRLRGR